MILLSRCVCMFWLKKGIENSILKLKTSDSLFRLCCGHLCLFFGYPHFLSLEIFFPLSAIQRWYVYLFPVKTVQMFFLSLGVKETLSTDKGYLLDIFKLPKSRYLLLLLLSNIVLKDILDSKRKQNDAKDKTIIIFR